MSIDYRFEHRMRSDKVSRFLMLMGWGLLCVLVCVSSCVLYGAVGVEFAPLARAWAL